MRFYRAPLRLYPASFRAEYGGEMAAAFGARHRETRGALARLALWLTAVADVVGNALAAHWEVFRQDLGVVSLCLVMTTAGCLLPALRAARLDPIGAIRAE